MRTCPDGDHMLHSRLRFTLLGLALLVFLASDVGTLESAERPGGQTPAYVPGEVLVKFKPQAEARHHASARADVAGELRRTFRSKAEHWRLGPGVTVEHALQRLHANPQVEYAEPNYVLTASVVPNDARFNEMWALRNTGQTGGTPGADIDATLAWDVSVGSPNVIVGDIDTGCDYNHPDLAANIWTNPGEIPGNGIDDDGNGFVDDVHGYDFYNRDGDPFDDNGHGTHTAGTIGAVGDNGIGVVGVNWNVKIMCIKFLNSGGSGSTDGAIQAIDYATQMGVDLTSNSWGGGGFSQALYDAIAAAGTHEMAFVAAAGNNGRDTDTFPNYPSAFDLANIVAVAATDDNDRLASFSNYGATTVDLAAPGVSILSTLPGASYGGLSGTSMATPHVAGVLALMRAVSPNVPVAQMKASLLSSVDRADTHPNLSGLVGKCVSEGRLNALHTIGEPDVTPPGAIADLSTVDPGSNTMALTWTATGDDDVVGTASYYQVRYSTAPIDDTSWSAATRAGNEPTPQVSGSPESMEIHGLAASALYYFAIKAFDEWGNAGPISNIASGTTLPPPTGSVDPTSVSADTLSGGQADQPFTLSNVGVGTLDFNIPAPQLGDLVIQNVGGPDSFGYRWVDSDQPGGPTFQWIDISTTGSDIGLASDDATSQPIPLGFNFPLYGNLFDSIRVCTNGWASFTSSATTPFNELLPSPHAPENLIAPYSSDLDLTSTGHVYFQSFGNRAIIQWQDVPFKKGSTTFTFQAILEASGSISFQYLNMTGASYSGTVGIQNADKTVALQIGFRQSYLHDNLAVRIALIPQWLTVFPVTGRLRAGESKLIDLHMNASGLVGGTYPGAVHVLSNDPVHPDLVVNASLHVSGAPQINVQPATLAYGDAIAGFPASRDLTVTNPGIDVLHVTDVTPSDATLSPSERVFDVAPYGTHTIHVVWTPAVAGAYSGSVTVHGNDATTPALVVPVTGNGLITPPMVTDPTTLSQTLHTGQQMIQPLTVYNTGGSNLVVNAAADQGGWVLVTADDVSAQGSGGPDSFGYRWKDSDASDGPTFSWVDINATGTTIPLQGNDAMSPAISMGMTFPFYGAYFSQLKVCTNGFITFDTTATSCPYNNVALPTTTLPKDSIAMFWDDLWFGPTRRASYLNDTANSRFIIQFTNVYSYPTLDPTLSTFQVLLYQNGKIVLQYKTMNTSVENSATIGIQGGGTAPYPALKVVANANYVHDSMAIEISRTPDWLVVTPSSATIPPGGNAVFNVGFDAALRAAGVCSGAVVLTNNLAETRRIPVELTVIGAPVASVDPTSFAYGTRFVGYPYLSTLQVTNTGTDALDVLDVTTNDASLTLSESATGDVFTHAAFSLPPGGFRLFDLRWLPTSPGSLPANASVQVMSDDPVNPTKAMPVSGTAIMPPIAAWTPPSFFDSVLFGDAVSHHLLHLENQGGSDLTYAANISPPAGWLSITPRSGTISASGSVDLAVDVNPSGLIGGYYSSVVQLTTNDPAHGVIQVPVSLHVTGIPHIGADPTALIFPTTFPGYSNALLLTVKNTGTDSLHLTDVSVSGDFAQSGITPGLTIPGQHSMGVTVRFAPPSPGTYHGQLTITSDDPDMGSLVIPLDGTSLPPPVIAVDPASISEILAPGGTSAGELSICNTGGSDLTWSGPAHVISAAGVTPGATVDLGNGEPDPGPGILGNGGPDTFGYRWKDSDAPGGPVFEWVDISAIGTPIPFRTPFDDLVAGIPLGMTFKFYGNEFTTINASTNGWLSFTSTVCCSYWSAVNHLLPTGGTDYPENMLAPFWDELWGYYDFGHYHGAYIYNDGSRFILQYKGWYRLDDDSPLDFEVILYPSGKIVYQYLSLVGTLNSATVGIQNSTRTDGLTVVFNNAYLHDNMAIEFKLPPDVRTAPDGGTVPAGTCATVTATFDASNPDTAHGTHTSMLRFTSNDPVHPEVDVPVTLTVNQKPIAVAGSPQQLECTGNNSASATLNGLGSSDPDSDPLTYAWTAPGILFDNPASQTPNASFPLGSTPVTLVVNDGYQNSDPAGTSVMVRDTMPPTIVCPPSMVIECQGNRQAIVSIPPATASDVCGAVTIANSYTGGGANASGSYPFGTTNVTFTATDGSGNTASCQTTVTVRDTIRPVVTAVASPNVLWPPNHKMTPVNTTVVATDACDPSPSIVLASVTSSEPDDAPGNGDGQTTGDIQDASLGTPDFQILLRAERDGNGPGRTYTITYQASDHSGNAAIASTQVTVPHDQGQGVEPLNLVVEGSLNTTLIWGPVDGSRYYDAIRGDLANLRVDGSNIDLGQVFCIAHGISGTTTAGYEDRIVPVPGQVFFYAVQFNDGTQDSSYGSESAGRARVVPPGGGNCR